MSFTLKFKQTKIEELNFEIARMTHWRLCSSSMVTRRESSWIPQRVQCIRRSRCSPLSGVSKSSGAATDGVQPRLLVVSPAANSALAMVRFVVDRLLAVQPKSGWVSVALPSD